MATRHLYREVASDIEPQAIYAAKEVRNSVNQQIGFKGREAGTKYKYHSVTIMSLNLRRHNTAVLRYQYLPTSSCSAIYKAICQPL